MNANGCIESTPSISQTSAVAKDLKRLYGHGQCASLALGVLRNLKLPCVVFFGAGEDDGAFHVANVFKDRFVDVYGVVTLIDLVARYGAPLTVRVDPDGSDTRVQFEVCMGEYGDDDKDPEGSFLAWNDCGELVVNAIAEYERTLRLNSVRKRAARI